MNTQKAIQEFLTGCNDPQGPVYKAAYKSFTRGQVETQAYAMRVGMHYDIDPRVLMQAAQEQQFKAICPSR